MALPRIRLPNIPGDVVPYAIQPDVPGQRAGFGGTASTARQDSYRDMLLQRGYSPSEAAELAYLEERQAFADRAEANRQPETRTRAQLASQNFSPTEIDRLVGRPTNVEANLAAAATPITLEPVAGARDPDQTAYNAATFAEGYGFDDSGNPAYLGKVDIDNTGSQGPSDRAAREYNAYDPRGAELALNYPAHPGRVLEPTPGRLDFNAMTEPGPETLDGRPARPPRPLNTPEEIEAYNVRPAGGLSQRDRDMMARGFAPVVTPGGVTYMRAAGDTQTIGGFGRAGSRPDLLTRENPYVVSERGDYMGPDGKPVSVLVPGPEMLAERAADLEGRQAAYQVKKAGMDADREEAKKMWRATAMLAGGSQNINSGNRGMYNQLAMMDDANRERALLYMSPAGRLAAEVDAGGARNAMRMMNAEALAGMDPTRQAERQRANEAAEAGLPPEQATRLSITRGQPMGSGLSAAYVGSRWNHWMNNFGPRPESWREQNFRSEMEGLGYSPAQIDQWIDQRRGAGGEADPGLGTSTGPGGLPAPPGSTPYRTGA